MSEEEKEKIKNCKHEHVEFYKWVQFDLEHPFDGVVPLERCLDCFAVLDMNRVVRGIARKEATRKLER